MLPEESAAVVVADAEPRVAEEEERAAHAFGAPPCRAVRSAAVANSTSGCQAHVVCRKNRGGGRKEDREGWIEYHGTQVHDANEPHSQNGQQITQPTQPRKPTFDVAMEPLMSRSAAAVLRMAGASENAITTSTRICKVGDETRLKCSA